MIHRTKEKGNGAIHIDINLIQMLQKNKEWFTWEMVWGATHNGFAL